MIRRFGWKVVTVYALVLAWIGWAQAGSPAAKFFCEAAAKRLEAHFGREVQFVSGAINDGALFRQPELHRAIELRYPDIRRSTVLKLEPQESGRSFGAWHFDYYGFYRLPPSLSRVPDVILMIAREASERSSHCMYQVTNYLLTSYDSP